MFLISPELGFDKPRVVDHRGRNAVQSQFNSRFAEHASLRASPSMARENDLFYQIASFH